MRAWRWSLRAVLRALALTAVVGLIAFGALGTSSLAGNDKDNGTVALLVKSKVALTPDVVSAISSHASRVTYVWPEIRAMALSATPAKMADLLADPVVEMVEADLQGQAPSDDSTVPTGLSQSPGTIVP